MKDSSIENIYTEACKGKRQENTEKSVRDL